MNKMLLVARHEYFTNLKSRTFLLTAFGMPIFITVIMVLVAAVSVDNASNVSDLDAIGYVDDADVITSADDLFMPIETIDLAAEMLNDGEIVAYIVISTDYMETGDVEAFSIGSLPDAFYGEVDTFLLSNLSEGVSSNFPIDRLEQSIDLTLEIQSMGRVLSEEAAVGLFMTPMIFAIVFLVASQISATFLMSSVVMEKTNRIMEILITSVTPMQLLMGKIIGLGSLGLTQMLIWIIVGVVIAVIGADSAILSGIIVPLDMVVLSIVYFVLTYFLLSSLMAGISVIVNAEQESRQIAGLFVFPFVLPFFFIIQLLEEPNGVIAVLLTLFPFSSAMTVIMRASFSTVPIEQIMLSLVLLGATSVGVAWVSAKIFRWATLLYGKRPSPLELWRVIRSRDVEIGTIVEGTSS